MDRTITIKYLICLCIITLFISGIFVLPVFASNTDGTIDSTYKYAWGENIGWINFGTTEGDVRITDSALTGYAWAENIGWIDLNPSYGGVTNDGEGNLSGHAWAENIGWINFNPTYGGVSIDSSGDFAGYAWGENTGWIVFNCATTNSCGTVNYKVKTDWRPQSARPACNNATDDDGDGLTDYPNDPGCGSLTDTDETDPTTTVTTGGGGSGSAPPFPTVPEDGFVFFITPSFAVSSEITLHFEGGSDITKIAIADNPNFSPATYINYTTSYNWVLSGKPGEKIFYAKFCNKYIRCLGGVSAKVIYAPLEIEEKKPIAKLSPPEVALPTEKPKKPFIEKVLEVLKPLVPEFLKPGLPEVAPQKIPIEELIPKQAPLTMRGKWNLLPQKAIERFVLAPLPKEIRKLVEKFPKLGETLKKVGITKITDIEKLKTVKLTLPGLTERVGLPTVEIHPGKFALPKGIPVAKLSSEIKQRLPTEIVFAKTAGELIDFNIVLTVSEKGKLQQKIRTISGKPLQLVVKPGKPVKSVKGYVVFKSKIKNPILISKAGQSQISKIQNENEKLSLNSLSASIFFVRPAFAKEHNPIEIEERLVLLEFEYTDPDEDGIYTAEIQAPLVEGEYEIITVMDFENPELGKKEIRLIVVVDPEGYIYEKDGDKETRIPSAIISIYWLNLETKQYELWPAKEYQQENPQITNTTGKYSFLVPEGSYYLKVEAPGYPFYDGKPFQVREGSGVQVNIELKTRFWWINAVDWKIILLILVIILLLYNFYRDKIKKRLLRR